MPISKIKWTLEEQWNGWVIKPEYGAGYVRVRISGISDAANRTAFYVAAALADCDVPDEWVETVLKEQAES